MHIFIALIMRRSLLLSNCPRRV